MAFLGQDGELAPSEAPPQCPPMAAGWGHLAITSANSVYSGINPAAKVVSLLEVKVRYPEKMLIFFFYFPAPRCSVTVPESPGVSPEESDKKRSRLPSAKGKVSTRLGM